MEQTTGPRAETSDRVPVHTRSFACTSYLRSDGLWDIEAKVEDCKHYEFSMLERGPFPSDAPYHSIGVTLTVDTGLKIVKAKGNMSTTPFDECAAAVDPLQKLVGASLGRGWRKVVDEALERTSSCTHMRELLYTVASSAIQAIPGYATHMARKRWPIHESKLEKTPGFIGGCLSWREDGPVVQRHYPKFHKPKS